MSNKIIVKSELTINAPAGRVWSFLALPERLARLFSPTATASFEEQRGSLVGSMTLNELTFQLKMTPYDLLLSSPSCTIVLRLAERADGRCDAVMAASCSPDSGFLVRERDLFNVLSRLRSVTGFPEDAAAPAAQESHLYHSEKAPQDSRTKTAGPRVAPAGRVKKLVLLALAVLLLAAAGVWLLPKLAARRESGVQSAQGAGDLSALVTMDNAKALAPGASRREVESLFGTTGVLLDDGRVVYRGEALNGAGQPVEQVCVRYASNAVSELTYLNLDNSTAVGALANSFPVVSATDLDGIAAQVGAPLSMFRRVAAGEGERLEAHFGYLDPFANFDPAWRGEIAVCVDTASGAITTDFCKGYDGSDPLMVDSLENSPLLGQYDAYSVYLQDKYQYDKALLMTAGFSRGDVERIYGALSEYDAGSGAMAYRVSSTEALEDGTTPVYQYSFGFEASGAFNMSAYVNMRLMNREGMLSATRWQTVNRNMSYGEIRTLMGILPTAVYVNDSHLILCYGKYVGGAETEQQFEFVVKLKRDTLYADSVYNNVADDEGEE